MPVDETRGLDEILDEALRLVGLEAPEVARVVGQAVGLLRAERDEWAARAQVAEAARARLERRVEALTAEIDRLKAELEEARRAAKRQAAPFARRRRAERPRKPGRKRGHPPANRPAPDQVDEELDVPLTACPGCGGPVEDVIDLAPQTVVDPPPEFRLHVRRFHTQSGWCRRCRRRVRSRHAEQTSTAVGAAGVQIGPRTLALAVDLKHRVGVTFRKVTGIFHLFFGLRVCAATLVRAERRITGRCEPTYRGLIDEARRAEVVHADETGWYIASAPKRAWLWVFAVPEPRITLFAIRLSRGGDVAQEILGADFAGTLGVDGWAGYLKLACRKGQCAGHLLRRCDELLEVQKRGAARFPLAVQRLLRDGIGLKHLAADLAAPDYAACADQVRAEMQALLGGDIREPANRRLARHLRNHHDELFTFLDVPLLAPTNNLAEQEIRPAVVIRKISAGNRTDPGAHVHEVLASLSRTAERNDLRLPDLLADLLRSTDAGYVLPLLPTWAAAPTREAGAPPRESDDGIPVTSSCPVRSAGRNVRRGRRAALPHAGEHARAPPA